MILIKDRHWKVGEKLNSRHGLGKYDTYKGFIDIEY